ncbi:MAG: hypothetical protein GY788_23225, partial [bacterium]|nr:hypothetical protein [bacterium]
AIKEKEPLQVLLEMVRIVESNVSEKRLELRIKLRRILEVMAVEILDFDLKPIALHILKEHDNMMVNWDLRLKENEYLSRNDRQILSEEQQLMIKDIKNMIDLRGLRNSVHADRQPIIAAYAAQFALHSTEVIRKSASIIQRDMSEFFKAVFNENIPEISKSAATQLYSKMKKEEAKAVED